MDSERWQKIKLILEDVLEIPPASRVGFLEKACDGDSSLRCEVERLLDFETSDDDLLERNIFDSMLPETRAVENLIGKRIGNYIVTNKIGAGGMGAVYSARHVDESFEQNVALKVIRPELISEAVLQRFYIERQILASLKHPNIAHLIDGGTTNDGLPYFVMEYVEGNAITEYAASENLTFDERLNLFRKVCAAVSFAHRNLVIHRDLKPSNILVTSDGTPKLLDFGIAKLLSRENAAEIVTKNFAFTPEYASPEQVRGEKLTTATDVYSLGVILYELLTGNRPLKTDNQSIGEIIKSICEIEPVRPSSVVIRESKKITSPNGERRTTRGNSKINPQSETRNTKSLKGDLDNIILKSLRKEPEHRYESVEKFAEDINRFQIGLPVSASRDTVSYRAGKFIKRHRLTVGLAALIFVLLFGGIAATTWQAIRAERERERAERRFENLRKISNSFVNEIHDAMRDLPGSLPARQLLITRATEQLDTLAAEADGNADLQLELVWAYQNLGALPDKNLRERQEIYEKAAALSRRVLESKPDDYDSQIRLAMVYLDLIYVARLRGDVKYTLEYNQKAVELVESAAKNAPNEARKQDDLWTVYYHYALTMHQLGRASEAIETTRKILPAAQYLYENNPPDTGKYNFMRVHLLRGAMGGSFNYLGDYEAAKIELKAALAECENEIAKNSTEDILNRNKANISLQLSATYAETDDLQTAQNHALNALSIREKMFATNPTNYDFQTSLADAETSFGRILVQKQQFANASKRFRHALELYEEVIAFDGERLQTRNAAARTRSYLGNALIANGETAQGLKLLRETINFYEQTGAAQTLDVQVKKNFAEANKWLGATLLDSANKSFDKNAFYSESRKHYAESLKLWRDLELRNVLRKSDSNQIIETSRQLEIVDSAIL